MTSPQLAHDDGGSFMAWLTDRERRELFRFPSSEVSAGDAIGLQGERVTSLVVLVQGIVKSTALLADGAQALIRLHSDGDILDADAIADGLDRSTMLTAVTQGKILSIPQAEIGELTRTFPGILVALSRELSRQLRAATRQRAFAPASSEQRLARVILDITTRFGQTGAGGLSVKPGLTQVELASLAGISRESTARYFRYWRSTGILNTGYRGWTITDPDLLAKIAEPDLEEKPIDGSARDGFGIAALPTGTAGGITAREPRDVRHVRDTSTGYAGRRTARAVAPSRGITSAQSMPAEGSPDDRGSAPQPTAASTRPSSSELPQLSVDELRLLQEVANGVTADVAARRLEMSGRALRRRLRAICDRLGVNTPIEAVVWASRRQLI